MTQKYHRKPQLHFRTRTVPTGLWLLCDCL